jgi:hypothetical protein
MRKLLIVPDLHQAVLRQPLRAYMAYISRSLRRSLIVLAASCTASMT